MKKATLLLIMLCGTIFSQAQDSAQRLVVWQKSGAKVYFDLNEEPETTFEDGQLVIKTTKATASYPLESVLRYTYEGTTTAIEPARLRPGEIIYHQTRDQLSFDGLAAGTVLGVYTLDGRLIGTQTAYDGQTSVVSFASQPAGTYLVKVGDATYKFMKR